MHSYILESLTYTASFTDRKVTEAEVYKQSYDMVLFELIHVRVPV